MIEFKLLMLKDLRFELLMLKFLAIWASCVNWNLNGWNIWVIWTIDVETWAFRTIKPKTVEIEIKMNDGECKWWIKISNNLN